MNPFLGLAPKLFDSPKTNTLILFILDGMSEEERETAFKDLLAMLPVMPRKRPKTISCLKVMKLNSHL